MTRRFWIAAIVGAPVFILAMADMLGVLPAWHTTVFFGSSSVELTTMTIVNWIGLGCSIPVVFWAGGRSSSVVGRPSGRARPTCSR